MNLNDFVVIPNKPKSVKLNARNLRELRMETVQLDQESTDMETRLQQLRQSMSREKEERAKVGGFRWKSGQAGALTTQSHSAKKNKETGLQKLSAGKVKVRVLKDEPVPEVRRPVERVPAPPPFDLLSSRKPRLKGKVCGQCEARIAGLMCAECGEDYCVGCFAKFHQKGALKLHRMIPLQAEIHTSISTLEVVSRFQRQVGSEEPSRSGPRGAQRRGGAAERRGEAAKGPPAPEAHPHDMQVLVVTREEEEEEEEDLRASPTLLRGHFDEEESARSFQEALRRWRGEAGDTAREEKQGQAWRHTEALPVSVEATGTQADLAQRRTQPVQVEFKQHSLSYMEKLQLKLHRRMPIEEHRLLSSMASTQEALTHSHTEAAEESRGLTAEEMELHRYCASLFALPAIGGSGEPDRPGQPCLNIVELDETVGDAVTSSIFGVEQESDNKKGNGEREDSITLQREGGEKVHQTEAAQRTVQSTQMVTRSPRPETRSIQPTGRLPRSPRPDQLTTQSELSDKVTTQSPRPKTQSPIPDKLTTRSPRPVKFTTQSPIPDQLTTRSELSGKVTTRSPRSDQLTTGPSRPDQLTTRSELSDKITTWSPRPSGSLKSKTTNTAPSPRPDVSSCVHTSSLSESPPDPTSSRTRPTPTPPEHLSSRSRLTASPRSPLSAHSAQTQAPPDLPSSRPRCLQSPSDPLSSRSRQIQSASDPLRSRSREIQSPSDTPSSRSRQIQSPSDTPSSRSRQIQSASDPLSSRSREIQSPSDPLSSRSREIQSPSDPLSSRSREIQSPSDPLSSRSRRPPHPTPRPATGSSQLALSPADCPAAAPEPESPWSSTPERDSPHARTFQPALLSARANVTQTSPSPPGSTASPQTTMSDWEGEMSSGSVELVSSEEDSSDEELRACGGLRGEEARSPSLSPSRPLSLSAEVGSAPHSSSHSEREPTEPGLCTEPSPALRSLAQRQQGHSDCFQGLDGFLTLGLDPGAVQPGPTPPRPPRSAESHAEPLGGGTECWRPRSSLRACAAEQLVTAVMDSQPISMLPRAASSAQSLRVSGLSGLGSASRPVSRPLSRAAQEIQEVLCVERADPEDEEEDEEDRLALARLEEEFRQRSTEPDSHTPQRSLGVMVTTGRWGGAERHISGRRTGSARRSTSQGHTDEEEEEEEEEEETLRDKLNVLSLP